METARGIATGAFAFTAAFSAMAAMQMLAGVPLAFLGTNATRDSARINHAAHRVLIAARPPDHQRSGGHADIGAVKIAADTFREVFDHGFAETGVSAGMAHRCTLETGLDANSNRFGHCTMNAWMARQHLS